MRGMFASICMLAALVALTASLPKYLGARLAGTGTDINKITKRLAERYDAPALAQTRNPEQPGGRQTLSPEENEVLGKIRPHSELMITPMAAKLLGGAGKPAQNEKPDATDFTPLRDNTSAAPAPAPGKWEPRMNAIVARMKANHSAEMLSLAKYLWAASITLTVAGLFALLLGRYGITRLTANLLFCLSSWCLIGLSGACIVFQIAGKVNIMSVLPQQFWVAPACSLLVSAGILTLVDLNSPVWNRTIKTLALPVTAALLTYGWGTLVQGAKCVI